jgi:hypothetical protein
MVLDSVYRAGFTFELKGLKRVGEATVVTVAFNEVASQETLVRDPFLRPVLSKGELLIEAGTGRIHHAVLNVTLGGLRVQFWTTYAPDEKLGIWVPTLFRKRYEQGLEPPNAAAKMSTAISGDYEDVVCEARYSKFRRFEATARIK